MTTSKVVNVYEYTGVVVAVVPTLVVVGVMLIVFLCYKALATQSTHGPVTCFPA